MLRTKTEEIKNWYLGFIDYFREEYDKLTIEEKKQINNTNNFLNPCQIEIFWIENPSFQFIILSNFFDRKDKEIIVNGPYSSHNFKRECIKVLNEDRWNRKISNEEYPRFIEKYDSLKKEMAKGLNYFVERFKEYVMSPVRQTGESSGYAIENMWAKIYVGDIADVDYVEEVNKIIKGFKKNAEQTKNKKNIPVSTKPIPTDQYAGFGVHFFPPIVLGKKRKRTIEEILNGIYPSWELKGKAFDTEIGKKKIIVNNDGFVFVESKNRIIGLKILNLIMAVSSFHKLPFFAVRDHELAQVNYEKTTSMITGMRWNPESRRAFLFEERWNPKNVSHIEKKEIEQSKLQEIFEDVDKLLKHEKLSEDLLLLNESYTHLQNSEFAQSFIMGWTVIERHYSYLWRSILHDTNVDDERFSKLTNSAVWSIDFVLENLSLLGKIQETDYDLLMELKKKRNKFYHSGKHVVKEDAERCLTYAFEILSQKISLITNRTYK